MKDELRRRRGVDIGFAVVGIGLAVVGCPSLTERVESNGDAVGREGMPPLSP